MDAVPVDLPMSVMVFGVPVNGKIPTVVLLLEKLVF
jgi:hypothetical protein